MPPKPTNSLNILKYCEKHFIIKNNSFFPRIGFSALFFLSLFSGHRLRTLHPSVFHQSFWGFFCFMCFPPQINKQHFFLHLILVMIFFSLFYFTAAAARFLVVNSLLNVHTHTNFYVFFFLSFDLAKPHSAKLFAMEKHWVCFYQVLNTQSTRKKVQSVGLLCILIQTQRRDRNKKLHFLHSKINSLRSGCRIYSLIFGFGLICFGVLFSKTAFSYHIHLCNTNIRCKWVEGYKLLGARLFTSSSSLVPFRMPLMHIDTHSKWVTGVPLINDTNIKTIYENQVYSIRCNVTLYLCLCTDSNDWHTHFPVAVENWNHIMAVVGFIVHCTVAFT